MGRTDGKLGKFLRDGLRMDAYINLNYEDEGNDVFSLEFPRFERSRENVYHQFAEILKDWYKCNGKKERYLNYSNGKAVFQAALKKSVYLVPLPAVGKKIMFRFATNEEAKAKRKLLKEKEKNSSGYSSGEDPLYAIADPSYRSDENALHAMSSPLSISSDYSSSEELLYPIAGSYTSDENMLHTMSSPLSVSSGYSSNEDAVCASPVSANCASGEDPWQTICGDSLYAQNGPPSASACKSEDVAEKNSGVIKHDDNALDSLNQSIADQIIKDLEKYFASDGEDLSALTNLKNEPTGNDFSEIQVACPQLVSQQQDLMLPFREVKFYWQLAEKHNFDSVLQLTFRKQFFIKNEGTYNPGDIIIPNEIWEKREYIWKNAVELDEKLFLFFQKA